MIDLHKLYLFHIVAQEKSFSAAAARLYITQPAVSQQMKELEAGLGQPLFERGSRGVTLTSGGAILAETARQVFALIAHAESTLTSLSVLTAGRLVLGATPGIGSYLIPVWIQTFRADFPGVTVTLHTGVTARMIEDVLAHRLDFAIIEGELGDDLSPRLAHWVLDDIEQHIVASRTHRIASHDALVFADLEAYPFIVRQEGSQSRIWLEQTLRAAGIEPRIGAEFDNFEAMKRAVAAGDCLALMPPYAVERELAEQQLTIIRVAGSRLVRQLRLIWERETPFSPLARRFLDYLRRVYPSMPQPEEA